MQYITSTLIESLTHTTYLGMQKSSSQDTLSHSLTHVRTYMELYCKKAKLVAELILCFQFGS